MKTPRQIVEDAIDLLNEKGWCQVTPTLSDGSMCLEMALTAAADQPGNYLSTALGAFSARVTQGPLWEVNNALHQVLGEKCRLDYCSHGWQFNDQPGRTKEEVIDLLKDMYAELPL